MMMSPTLSPQEVYRLRQFLLQQRPGPSLLPPHHHHQPPPPLHLNNTLAATASTDTHDTNNNTDGDDADSEYSEFPQTTHAWAVFADKTNRKATKMDRIVGTAIILFQLFTYGLFVTEAIEDYQSRQVPITISHQQCQEATNNYNQQQQLNLQENDEVQLQCEADVTNHFDAAVAFFMLR